MSVINGLLQQVCIHASAFARIWKSDALIGYALPRSLHPPLLSRWKLNSSSRHEKYILNGVLPTTNLHPPISFYRCVSTKMLFCVLLDGVIRALWHLSHSHVCVKTDLRLISCAYKGESVWCALMCMLDIIQTTSQKIHAEIRHSWRFESHIVVKVCPYPPYVIFFNGCFVWIRLCDCSVHSEKHWLLLLDGHITYSGLNWLCCKK